MRSIYWRRIEMEFAEYFNKMQKHYSEGNTVEVEKLIKSDGSKLVTYAEFEDALATIAQVTTLAIEQAFQSQEAKFGFVLKTLKEQKVISEDTEKAILAEFNNINELMEDDIDE